MTVPPQPLAPIARSAGALALRAAGGGSLVALGLLGVAFVAGAVPQGAAAFALGGAGLALAAGLVGCLVLARAVRAPAVGDGHLQGQRVQVALALTFAVKLLAALLGVGLLWLRGVKFPHVATFAISFATVALVFQLVGAVVMARALGRRRAGGNRALATTDSKPAAAD